MKLENPMKLEMSAPLEVGLCCHDLPRLRRFYEDVMDFEFISKIVVPAEKAAPSGLSADGYTVVRLQTSYGERLKLLAPNTPPLAQAPSKFILDRAGSTYLTFIVEDIDSAIDRLHKAQAPFLTGDKRVEVRPGVYLAFCRDPEGNVLELVQYADIDSYRSDLKNGTR
jgi:catechol 2,3-dioxygenase-like lactoylglutathione lyase family enzyme